LKNYPDFQKTGIVIIPEANFLLKILPHHEDLEKNWYLFSGSLARL
jgi:hypothetical protein